MPVDTVITGGTLVTATDMLEGAVAFDDGTIVAVGCEESMPEARETVDASGLLVMPGIIDPHVHIEDHFSIDSYETGTAAAALGDVTTYIDFAWQHWVGDLSNYDEEGTLMDGLAEKKCKGERAIVDYGVHAAITREDPAVLDELEGMVDAGVTSFKLFTAYEIGLGYGFMNRVLERLADLDAVQAAADDLGYDSMRIFSGAGHDASHVHGVCDTAMVFAVSEDGKSHNEDEYTSWDDCYASAQTIANAAFTLAQGQ